MKRQTTMSNDQAPMTNETETKRQCPITACRWALVIAVCSLIGHCGLVIGHSLAIGAWSLVIPAVAAALR
jgi:hypothetical protein